MDSTITVPNNNSVLSEPKSILTALEDAAHRPTPLSVQRAGRSASAAASASASSLAGASEDLPTAGANGELS